MPNFDNILLERVGSQGRIGLKAAIDRRDRAYDKKHY